MENVEYNIEEKAINNSEKLNIEAVNSLKKENIELGKKLAVLYNVVEISNYINSFISKANLIQLINDMIMGVLGVTYSTIYLMEEGKLKIKATNIEGNFNLLAEENKELLTCRQATIINIDAGQESEEDLAIRAKMGIPIQLGDRLIGYIVVEHTHYGYFTEEHKLFINTIANQVAIAIENAALYRKLEVAAQMDSLMGIYNRRTFYSILEKKIKNKDEYAIAMVDFDNFKAINDRFGHQFGDEVLIRTCNLIKSNLSKDDIVGRYGGEELIIYIDDVSNYSNVYDKIDSIRKEIMNNIIEKDGNSFNATTSIGIAFSSSQHISIGEVINKADRMLYKAKAEGKNKVIALIE